MAHRERNHRGQLAARRKQAWALYLAGETSRRAIGRAIGVSHVTVSRYLSAILDEIHQETVATAREARRVELARLDAQLRNLWPQALRGNLKAHELVLKIGERRSRLLGLEAPEKREHSGPEGGPVQVQPVPALLAPEQQAALGRALISLAEHGGRDDHAPSSAAAPPAVG